MKPSSIACFMEYRWNASFLPFVLVLPNSLRVVGFGVAVNANTDTFSGLPFLLTSFARMSSASTSSPSLKTSVTAFMFLPAVDECASSIITAKCLSLSAFTLPTIYGNFWIVVTTIFVLPSSARPRSADVHFSSITRMNPDLCSNESTACCSWRSTTTLSVQMMILSKIILFSASCSDAKRYDSHAISFVFPEPAECCSR